MSISLDVLIATMNQTDDSFLDNMKIQSDVIVCNQNVERTLYRKYERNNHVVRWYDFQEKGVGLNRNNALMRSDADICLIADDDVVYEDGYSNIIINAFEKNPKADVILFNVKSTPDFPRFECNNKMRITQWNCGRFGGVRIAFRRNSVVKNAISFSLIFGGGALFSAGEDNMFIRDCIRKKLRVIAVPDYILSLNNDRESTWFKGYTQKWYEDMGTSYVYHYGKYAYICAALQLIRHRNTWLKDKSFFEALKYIRNGIHIFKNL